MRGGPELESRHGNVAEEQCMISHCVPQPTRACRVERQRSTSDSRTPVSRDYSAPGSPVCYAVLSCKGKGGASAWHGRTPVDPAEPTESEMVVRVSFATRFPKLQPLMPLLGVTNRTNTLST